MALDAETDTTVTGSSGNDTISTGAALTTGSVNAGAGTDRLIVGTTAHLNSATLAGKYTNFETLEITNGVAIDPDLLISITAVVRSTRKQQLLLICRQHKLARSHLRV